MDIIEEGVNGHLVPVGDAAALADKLVAVLSLDDKQWLAMSDAALHTAHHYSWDDATARFESALIKTVARSRDRQNAEVPQPFDGRLGLLA